MIRWTWRWCRYRCRTSTGTSLGDVDIVKSAVANATTVIAE
jgi:hypothetical protein